MKATWGANERIVTLRVDLDDIVDVVRRSEPATMIFLEAEDGQVLVFGVGLEQSVLTFVARDGTSFHSVGRRGASGYLQFLCRDQVDDFLAEMAVPQQQAVTAAAEFQATEERPRAVEWESDW